MKGIIRIWLVVKLNQIRILRHKCTKRDVTLVFLFDELEVVRFEVQLKGIVFLRGGLKKILLNFFPVFPLEKIKKWTTLSLEQLNSSPQ
jgi:hypothetical protein